MNAPTPEADEIAEMIREDHLRLAVLLDVIEDGLTDGTSVSDQLAQLRIEYDSHALRKERAVALCHPQGLEMHRHDHARMRALLERLSAAHDAGDDIASLLGQVVSTFTRQLIPAAAVLTAPRRP